MIDVCPRCEGLLVAEPSFDINENIPSVLLVRCINCGHRDDGVMARHRAGLDWPDLRTSRKNPRHFQKVGTP